MSRPALESPATIGVFGSGQLGRMLAFAARPMGYHVHVYSPGRDTPAGRVADREVTGAYDDREALEAFIADVDVVTFEFENVPAGVAEVAQAAGVPVRPGGHVLHVAQHRGREKTFFAENGLPVAPFKLATTESELRDAVASVGLPAVMKTAAFGYDGKGQSRVDSAAEARSAWGELGRAPVILESWVEFEREISVVAARGVDGDVRTWTPSENDHSDHILDVSAVPAPISTETTRMARALAERVVDLLDVVGVLCVEMFHLPEGHLLLNEIAPRPHNSGHLTIEASVTSQFEQQARAACGVSLGPTDLVRPAAMANLLGDLWADGVPDWQQVLAVPGVKLHLYGKDEARPGRKMGHLTALGDSADEARALVLEARRRITPRSVARSPSAVRSP